MIAHIFQIDKIAFKDIQLLHINFLLFAEKHSTKKCEKIEVYRWLKIIPLNGIVSKYNISLTGKLKQTQISTVW